MLVQLPITHKQKLQQSQRAIQSRARFSALCQRSDP
jgi:hypothetical protein